MEKVNTKEVRQYTKGTFQTVFILQQLQYMLQHFAVQALLYKL